ncbi:hypothetical protein U9M48_012214 [Paspalum notatum var. saurae]|uniref:Alpha galactosidase C-terminal domain-containing protein n=1 Tax=Paspalum notatum var. saurae TaxID=547442 RepID=A0AAQ3SXD9_PASNO
MRWDKQSRVTEPDEEQRRRRGKACADEEVARQSHARRHGAVVQENLVQYSVLAVLGCLVFFAIQKIKGWIVWSIANFKCSDGDGAIARDAEGGRRDVWAEALSNNRKAVVLCNLPGCQATITAQWSNIEGGTWKNKIGIKALEKANVCSHASV